MSSACFWLVVGWWWRGRGQSEKTSHVGVSDDEQTKEEKKKLASFSPFTVPISFFLPSRPESRPSGELPGGGAEERAREGARSLELRATHSSPPSIGSPSKERRPRQKTLPPSAPRGGSRGCTWLRRPRRKRSRGRASWARLIERERERERVRGKERNKERFMKKEVEKKSANSSPSLSLRDACSLKQTLDSFFLLLCSSSPRCARSPRRYESQVIARPLVRAKSLFLRGARKRERTTVERRNAAAPPAARFPANECFTSLSHVSPSLSFFFFQSSLHIQHRRPRPSSRSCTSTSAKTSAGSSRSPRAMATAMAALRPPLLQQTRRAPLCSACTATASTTSAPR